MKQVLLVVLAVLLLVPGYASAGDAGGTEADNEIANALERVRAEASGTVVARLGVGRAVRWVAARGGTLTGQTSAPAPASAQAWLSAHSELFGLTPTDVERMAVARDLTLPGRAKVVLLRQAWESVPAVEGGSVVMTFDGDGRLVSVGADTSAAKVTNSQSLSPGDAVRIVADRAFGLSISPEQVGERAGFMRFEKGPGFADHWVRAGVLPTPGGARHVWDVYFIASMTEARRALVDAETGAILRSNDLVKHSREEGLVFDNHPGAASGGTQVVRSFEGDPDASPQGWVGFSGIDVDDEIGRDLGLSTLDAITTIGNNASTFLNWSNFLVPADQANRPIALLGHFNFPFSDSWARNDCRAVLPSYAEDKDSAATNLFYHHNVMHDFFFELGFTEAAGNLQVANFSGEGLPGDPIQGLVQAGAATGGSETGYTGRDNAYMLTLPDGLPAWSGMFLWEPINDVFEAPCRDGDFDASVIYHEYTHAVSNRMVPDLVGYQGGSMGEAWSDYFALDYLHKEGFTTNTVVGEYVTGNPETGIRNWKVAEVPVTYGDLGYDITGPEVHADGEIWAGVLWRLRERLVAAHGAAEGAERARRIIVGAMPMSAPDPSMVDMRDAILAADRALYGGADEAALWAVFASVGLGASASSNGSQDTDPSPSFDNPLGGNGTVSGTLTNATTGGPVAGARIIVGPYEARVSPVVRSGTDGSFSFGAQAGTYDLTVQTPGFGATTATVTVKPGATTNASRVLRPNLSSFVNGATVKVTNQGLDSAEALIDDTEGTSWTTGDIGEPINSAGRKPSAEIDLAGGKHRVGEIRVSAFKNTGAPRFAAVKEFKVELLNGDRATTVWRGNFETLGPRPVAPKLHYMTFKLPKTVTADGARITILSVQGETLREGQIAELQLFGTSSESVEPQPGTQPDPFTSETNTIVGTNPAGDQAGGVTENEFAETCSYPPASQGADAWTFEIPTELGRGNATMTAFGEGSPVGHDLDLVFYSRECSNLGGAASPAADESGAVPFGTRYVVVNQWLGLNTSVHIEVIPQT